MATESMQVNGNANYAPHHGYGGIDQQHFANNVYAQQAPPAANTPATSASTQSEIPKDEVGWYFVEQYYTTLSRTPDKLYLYYNKRSQYVSGNETDKVQVCVGQRVSTLDNRGGTRRTGWMLTQNRAGHQRQDKRARLPRVQGPHHQRRLASLRRQHHHPSHRRDLQQVATAPQVHPDFRPRNPDQRLLRSQRHLPLHHRGGG